MFKKVIILLIISSFGIIQETRARGTVMVFSPHPDDDILGCGGTLIHHVKKGHHVIIVYMTSGGASKWHATRKELERIREIEARNAADKIGVTELIFLREPDAALTRTAAIVSKVESLLLVHKPNLVFIPHRDDDHEDHKATYYIVTAALKRAQAGNYTAKPPKILCYEVWTPLLKITHQENISDVMSTKLLALAEHKSQLTNLDYSEAIKGLNCYRGHMTLTGAYAEAFAQKKLGDT